MEKYGVVKVGKTPSVVSGKPSTKIVDEEPLCEGEQLKKVASSLFDKDVKLKNNMPETSEEKDKEANK